MSLRISAVPTYNYCHTNNKSKNRNVNFNGAKHNILRNMSYAMVVSSLFAAYSCINRNNNTNKETDNPGLVIKEQNKNDTQIRKSFHYFPKDDNNINSDQFDWSETFYPDGRIVKDSLGHLITITPDGERTVIKTEIDQSGNIKITTDYPDKTRVEKTEYKTKPQEKLYVEKTFWSNGNIKECKYYNEYLDSTSTYSKKEIEYSCERYNENGVLLYWDSDIKDPERNKIFNKYDRKGRLIYDDVKNENYKYKGQSRTPYKSISRHEDCERITLYNDSGSVQKIYFKAADGTITKI